MAAPLQLTRTHRILIGVVVAGAVVIAGIGFAGSYAAVRELAEKKGFGDFSLVFPIGIDAGICVLLALDLLLTWIRIPFPLLRQTAWLLTAATIAFNGAAAWPDPLGVGMHAVIPVLFVVAVEAARHAVGRIADITADKHMEGVRISRWLLSPVPTFLLWRRMKLWELRSYEQVIKLEQERLVYQARLRSRFGRAWRRKAPVESLMPLRLAKYGVPLAETAPDGLAAAGIEPRLLPGQPAAPELESKSAQENPETAPEEAPSQWFAPPQKVRYQGDYDPNYEPPTYTPPQEHQSWYDGQPQQIPVPQPGAAESGQEPGSGQGSGPASEQQPVVEVAPEPTMDELPASAPELVSEPIPDEEPEPRVQVPNGAGGMRRLGEGVQEAEPSDEDLYQVFRYSIDGEGMPTPGAFAANVEATYQLRLQPRELNQYMGQFTARLTNELLEDHIA
ncbi:DUF2637 domain-containing protein [Streptomyces sp. NA04227]|uniref:DUF2637 domain-containing protein n=1 Tax=Streptomyces sp. NA04227 TaxID=2742136 RepID=UPI00158FF924|nr:DUF2637 domain-containing protein [Streptomyces sp. NA04227]QKW08387.1 DUF2637 domain-containing protein [Streptomyces sp. NA04227]